MASMAPHLAEVANLVGDLARANILSALMDNRALTAKELAFAARVSPQTTSSHLAKMTDAKLLQVCKQGRCRYYRLASPLVAQMLEAVMVVAADKLPRLPPSSKPAEELRAARSCYDHLAGRLGVALADALTARGFIILEPEGAQVTGRGMDFFDELGLEINLLPKGGDHSAGPVWTGASGVITWLAVSMRFFSDSVWTIAGLNVATTAARWKSPNSGRGNSRTYFKSSIRHWP